MGLEDNDRTNLLSGGGHGGGGNNYQNYGYQSGAASSIDPSKYASAPGYQDPAPTYEQAVTHGGPNIPVTIVGIGQPTYQTIPYIQTQV